MDQSFKLSNQKFNIHHKFVLMEKLGNLNLGKDLSI